MRRIDAIFDAERPINGLSAAARLAVRQQHIAPLVTDLETWMRESRGKLSRHNPVAKAMDYMLVRWETFARFLGDGRICLTNNAAERALRGIALGRKSWLFAGSDRGGDRAAAIETWTKAVEAEDAFAYDEPPGWYYPVRESLGAALLRDGRAAEAEQVFRADLERTPRNPRSLFGLSEALEAQKKDADARWARAQFQAAWKNADVRLRLEDL